MSHRYDAVSVRNFSANGEDRTAYTNIGVAFPFKDKDGYTVRLNAIPAPVEGEYVIMLFPPRERDGGGGPQRESSRPQSSNRGYGGGLDRDIPFEKSWR